MLRLLFVMITTTLLGLGTGYFLWGSRVARLTEALSTMTLESETMRARLAAPRLGEDGTVGVKATDELRVINEAIAAFRQELAEQKTLLQTAATQAPQVPLDAQGVQAQLRVTRTELERCNADRQDLTARCGGAATPPHAVVPGYVAPAPAYAPPPAPPAYEPEVPDYEAPPDAPAAPPSPGAYQPRSPASSPENIP